MSVQLLKRLFTFEEYHKMVDAGIFIPNDRLELIGGEIVQMSPLGRIYAVGVISNPVN